MRTRSDPPPAAVGPEWLSVWADLLRFHRSVIDELERELAQAGGIPLTWFDVLIQLANTPDGRLRMQELAAAVVVSRSGLTRLVDRLEEAGLVTRASCPSDRRGTFAAITPAGRAALRKASPVHLQGVAEHFANRLSSADIAALRTALDKLLPPAAGTCQA